MNVGMVLTLSQALQLVGLAPTIFIILFLAGLAPRNKQTVIPIFYFIAVSCGFALPLQPLYGPIAHSILLRGGLLFGESTLSAFSFLLICQFLLGRVPPVGYWLVLAIPIIGGSSLIYAMVIAPGDECAQDLVCPDVASLEVLYNTFGSSMVFLLLIYYSSKLGELSGQDATKRQKYWLILALILVHVMVLAIDLARLAGQIGEEDARFIATVLRLSFIYLVLTSLFRVFYPALGNQVIMLGPQKPAYDPQSDFPHAQKVRYFLDEEHIYREMRLNRAALAKAVGVNENVLSRVINRHFGKSFNELINQYRVDDAKRRLRSEKTLITTIGFEVGFNSTASFNRVFRELVGKSPTQYRKDENEKPEG